MVLFVTLLCIAVSVALNVAHAPANAMARGVAGLPPVAAFFVIELIARIPSSNRLLSVGRVFGALVVGGIAGTISYIQQVEYVRGLGFGGWIASAFPIVIDGTMLVTTLSLVEVVRKVRQLEDADDEAPAVTREDVEVADEPELTAAGAADPGLPDAPVSPAPAAPGRPRKPVKRTADGVLLYPEEQRLVPARSARRIKNQQPERLDD
jgi:hypothetical protein